jgi:hypothetical protein
MQLRYHPLMSRHGTSNWPPMWITSRNDPKDKATGEVGTLTEVLMPRQFEDKLFLVIEHEAQRYMGALTFDDPEFCSQLYRLLQGKVGLSIREIGDLDLPHTHVATISAPINTACQNEADSDG